MKAGLRRARVVLLAAAAGMPAQAPAQTTIPPAPQNPSPMVEHTREHPRLKEERPEGRREKLAAGTLFVPASLMAKAEAPLLLFMHGGAWIPEVAAARRNMAAIVIQRSDGYRALFEKEDALAGLRKAPRHRGAARPRTDDDDVVVLAGHLSALPR